MSRLDREPQVRELAERLGLGRTASPVEAILAHCRQRIDRWVAEAGSVTTIGQLERLVTQRLQMVFEEVHADEDFDRLKLTYTCWPRSRRSRAGRMRSERRFRPPCPGY